jgi:hypothetical protein
MKTPVIEVGGTHVKIMVTDQQEESRYVAASRCSAYSPA